MFTGTCLLIGLVAKIIAGTSGKHYSVEVAIAYLYDNDLSNGKIDKTLNGFDQDALLTRAEAVQFFKLTADKGFNKELIKRHQDLDPSPTINTDKYDIKTSLNKVPGYRTVQEVKAILEKYHYDIGRYYDIDGHRGVSPCYRYEESGNNQRLCVTLSLDFSFDSFDMTIYSKSLIDHIVKANEEEQFAEFVKTIMELYGFPTTDSTIEDIEY